MKRKIALLALLAVFAAIAASGTIAYFTSETHAHNVITSGGIDIEIRETMEKEKEDGTGTEIVEFVNNQTGIMPSTSLSKIVEIKNLQEKAWIRVKLGIGIQKVGTSGDSPMPEVNTLDTTITVNGKEEELIQLMFDDSKLSTLKTIEADPATADFRWIYHDGYWYCIDPVEMNDMTGELFTRVYFNEKMGNEYQNCTVFIDVDAEAVQYANNNTIEGTDTVIEYLTVDNLSNIKGW